MEKYPTKKAYATGKLYKFLKEKGVYKQFVENCKKQKAKGKELRGYKTANAIGEAFIWEKTPEGNSFWANIWNVAWSEIG